MPVTAWKATGTVVNDNSVGTINWDSDDFFAPLVGTECLNDDNIYAGTQLAGSGVSVWLKATNFGFTSTDIPAGSTIDGFEVEVRQFKSGTIVVSNTAVRLVKANAVVGTSFGNTTDWATTETVVNYGGTTQLGGTSWVQSDVVASNFGVAISITNASSALPISARNRLIDQIRVRVNYTLASTFNPRMSSSFLVHT